MFSHPDDRPGAGPSKRRPGGGRDGRAFLGLMALVALATAGVVGGAFFLTSTTIHDILKENRELKKAIGNLTAERTIGYATVESQSRGEEGQLKTTLRLVQTAEDSPRDVVAEQRFTIEGRTAHFDTMVVKFTREFVEQGKGRALFLWRRVYGEDTPPSQGRRIDTPGQAPQRYDAITRTLGMEEQQIFWEAIWDLANNPDYLSRYGIEAVYGNAVYTRLDPSNVYLFKTTATGQLYPEVVRDW